MKRNRKHRKKITAVLVLMLMITMMVGSADFAEAGTYQGTWWLKVNTQCNVVTAYKRVDGEWEPVRAMICSTGLNDTTPQGGFFLKGRWNWGALYEGVYGQYCTHITGDILFHSVFYNEQYKKNSMPIEEYNKLGEPASHGCVRLTVMDAKWIYENCPKGTKVTIYSSSKPGPLGKPERIPVITRRKTTWDPTDPDPKNPNFKLKPPVITVSPEKATEIPYGSKYSLTSGVSAQDPNTFMNLDDLITVSKVKKWSADEQRYVTATFSTKKPGTYKVTYKVNDPYSGRSSKTIKLKVMKKHVGS